MPAVTFIDAIPNHISEEDHRSLTGATPVSFSDIPPVLRHKVNDVAVTFDPPLDGFSGEDSARGTLYIIERYVVQHSHQIHTADMSPVCSRSSLQRRDARFRSSIRP